MKQPKKLARSQKEIIAKDKLNPENWMLLVENKEEIVFVHKISGKQKLHKKRCNDVRRN